MDQERYDFLRLALIPGVLPRYFHRLLNSFSSPGEILEADLHSLHKSSGLPKPFLERFVALRAKESVEGELDGIAAKKIRVLLYGDEEYPEGLRHLHDPPPILYVKGSLQREDLLAFAVVGARRCSHYGRTHGRRVSRELASRGISVVSGMARGIDSEAHWGAIEAEGRTIAVLGSGLEVVYPPENRDLYQEISRMGAVVSEFPLHTPPVKENFPRRNRIIAGLSLGVIVIEASCKSGSLITAAHALDQGKDVFALPGPIDSPFSRGTHRLLKEGAQMAEGAEDILQSISFVPPGEKSAGEGKGEKVPEDEKEREVYALLSSVPLELESLNRRTKMGVASLLSLLTSLELGGWIERLSGNRFVKREPAP